MDCIPFWKPLPSGDQQLDWFEPQEWGVWREDVHHDGDGGEA